MLPARPISSADDGKGRAKPALRGASGGSRSPPEGKRKAPGRKREAAASRRGTPATVEAAGRPVLQGEAQERPAKTRTQGGAPLWAKGVPQAAHAYRRNLRRFAARA